MIFFRSTTLSTKRYLTARTHATFLELALNSSVLFQSGGPRFRILTISVWPHRIPALPTTRRTSSNCRNLPVPYPVTAQSHSLNGSQSTNRRLVIYLYLPSHIRFSTVTASPTVHIMSPSFVHLLTHPALLFIQPRFSTQTLIVYLITILPIFDFLGS